MADVRSSPVLVSAPGKAILHGEHAVVYGKPALASSLDLRCFLLLLSTHSGAVVLELPDLQLEMTWKVSELAESLSTKGSSPALCLILFFVQHSTNSWGRAWEQGIQLELLKQLSGISSDQKTPPTQSLAVLAFLYLLTHIYEERLRELSGLHVTVVATLPASAGLGSSAAYSVCIAAALLCNSGAINKAGSSDSVCNSHMNMKDECRTESGQQHTDESCVAEYSSCTEEAKGILSGHSTVTANCLPEVLMKKMKEYGHPKPEKCYSVVWNQNELEQINKWGFEAEKLIHGTPSGIDNSISTFGGAIRFQSGHITPLQKVPHVHILLVYTKVPRSTKELVAGVRARYEKFPDILGPVLDSITAIVQTAQTQFEQLACLPEDTHSQEECKIYSALQELFTFNQHLLDTLGVGHPALQRVCNIAQQFGLAAKLTGAGGGGCAIALVPPGFPNGQLSEAKTAFTKAGFVCWQTTIGSKGVTQHTFSE